MMEELFGSLPSVTKTKWGEEDKKELFAPAIRAWKLELVKLLSRVEELNRMIEKYKFRRELIRLKRGNL